MSRLLVLVLIWLSYFQSQSQDTLSFKINSGGASVGNLAYSIGDLISTSGNAIISAFPINALPPQIITDLNNYEVGEIQVAVFPNPVTKFLSINSDAEKGTLMLFDGAGRAIKELSWPTEIDMTAYSNGEYYLVLVTAKKVIKNYKIIKN